MRVAPAAAALPHVRDLLGVQVAHLRVLRVAVGLATAQAVPRVVVVPAEEVVTVAQAEPAEPGAVAAVAAAVAVAVAEELFTDQSTMVR